MVNEIGTDEDGVSFIKLHNGARVLVDKKHVAMLSKYCWRTTGKSGGYVTCLVDGSEQGRVKMYEMLYDGVPTVIFLNRDRLDYRKKNILPIHSQLRYSEKRETALTDCLEPPVTVPDIVAELKRFYPDGPPPFPKMSDTDCIRDFVFLYNQENKMLERCAAFGATLCNAFFGDARVHARHKEYPNMADMWRNTANMTRVCKKMTDFSGWTIENLYKAYTIQYYMACNFRPMYARNIYDYMLLPGVSNKRVLDPCAGFGGRLLGFYASTTCSEYVGIDPNPLLTDPFKNMMAWMDEKFPTLTCKKKVSIYPRASEDVIFETLGTGGLYDIVFTSPPYWDIEVYNKQDPNQVHNRYSTVLEFHKGFFEPLMAKSCNALKPGGVFALNIRYPPMEECMHAFMATRNDMTKMPDMVIPRQVRMQLKSSDKKHHTFELVFVWQKSKLKEN